MIDESPARSGYLSLEPEFYPVDALTRLGLPRCLPPEALDSDDQAKILNEVLREGVRRRLQEAESV